MTRHRIPNPPTLGRVKVSAKKFNDMREALDRVTKELNSLKSNKDKESKEGYSLSHYSCSDQYTRGTQS